ncbi:ead/Ea22-like family protein [Citrobacter freundii]|uniref:ead/Ea22-like family protein n=2 Tax=Enterobacteriaceae TaxID=543 RepID=UPI001E2FE475|nr:ead/Ea22-like family protein [Citrobacter freundii]MCT4733162.1 ead/Ea22-like family protein [Citrobacter freundii]MDE9595957.1 ead/Ea22-like family protein [Citrobacter freundii]MDE9713557.1 ead/Ea22-like family protein [Citrobacter freundii]MDE9723171.1 ead/Ea22-like family protein [Citrobacter freundii]MDE9732647.1 ead/Ea22-like family protein [Citrobacter freundii]
MLRSVSDTSDAWQDEASPEAVLALLDELEAAEKRIAELSASHSKLRDTMATIHNTIRMDGGYTPLAAILNAAKRAHEESATAAGIGVKGE